MVFRIAHGGANWVIAPVVLAIVLFTLAAPLDAPWLQSLSIVPFSLALFFVMFFRDPDRRTAKGIASPADGKVVRIDEVDDSDVGPAQRLSIFMRPTDVHVNRFPVEGNVRSVTHYPGKHVPAFNKDSERNERVVTLMKSPELGDVKVIQIAGAVARRIVPYSEAGDSVAKGERLGLIRLGSRCDLFVPRGSVEWTVEIGQRVYAGSTQVAEAKS